MRRIWYKTAINEALKEEMAHDERVFLIGEDVDIQGGVFKISRGLLEQFGARRVKGTPISEAAFLGLASGAAMMGLRPVVELMYVDFSLTGMDQLINQGISASYMSGGKVSVPIVFRGQYGSETSEAAQHSRQFEQWFAHTAGVYVAMPSTVYDAKGLLKTAVRNNNPVMYLESRNLYNVRDSVPEGEWFVPFGKAAVRRSGSDLTLIAYGNAAVKAAEAAGELDGVVDVELIDPRTLVPLDIEAISASVRKTGTLLVVQEANIIGGVGSEIVRRVCEEAFSSLKVPPKVLGAHSVPTPFSPVLEKAYLPQKEDIIREIQQMASRKQQ